MFRLDAKRRQNAKRINYKTKYFGYIVSQNVIKTDPEKISTIMKYPAKQNIRELRSFLGLTGYYRKFVQNYSKMAKQK